VLGAIGNKSGKEGLLLTFCISAYDPDTGDTLTFTYSSSPALPTGLLTKTSATTATFSWTPSSGKAGTYNVTFKVEDDGTPSKSNSKAITITISSATGDGDGDGDGGDGVTTTGGTTGGGGGGTRCGLIILYPSTTAGELVEDITGTSCDERVTVFIPKGTMALNRYGVRLRNISIEDIVQATLPLPSDYKLVGIAYNILPDGSTFEPPIDLTIEYDDAMLPEGVTKENLIIATYDSGTRQWTNLESTWVSLGAADTGKNAVRTGVNHLTYFAILAHTAPAPPAPPPTTPAQPPAPAPTPPPTVPTAPT